MTHRRLSGTVENPFAVWTSGDATLSRIAGGGWKLKERFQLPPEALLADFHQGSTRGYQISEIELITSVGIVVFWGDLLNGRRIILLGTDNQNTSPWLDNRVAKKGLSPGIIATFHVWCVKNGLAVYPFYLRSVRNVRPDFITRESEREISLWAGSSGYKRIGRPWRWESFIAYAPRLNWIEDRVVNIPRKLNAEAPQQMGPVAEWRPRGGITMQIFSELGSKYVSLGGLNLF